MCVYIYICTYIYIYIYIYLYHQSFVKMFKNAPAGWERVKKKKNGRQPDGSIGFLCEVGHLLFTSAVFPFSTRAVTFERGVEPDWL